MLQETITIFKSFTKKLFLCEKCSSQVKKKEAVSVVTEAISMRVSKLQDLSLSLVCEQDSSCNYLNCIRRLVIELQLVRAEMFDFVFLSVILKPRPKYSQ